MARPITFAALLSLLAYTAAGSSVWTVNCAPLTQQRSDPIVDPGTLSAHVHSVVGSTAFSNNMPGRLASANGLATTCDKFTDHSTYWAPSLYRREGRGFQLLPFTGMVAYYENYTCSYNPKSPGICPTVSDAIAFPSGLRMVAGNTTRRTLDESDPWQAAILLENGNSGEVYGIPKMLDGGRLSGHARFPSCWDGKNLDSADHQSHVAYPTGGTQGGMCPKSHPVAMINIGPEFGWDLQGITDASQIVFANGDTTGYGFHADFLMGWKNRHALQNSFSNCFTNDNCPWRAFGAPGGVDPNPTPRSPQHPAPAENIGLNRPIRKLPGNNPVYRAPGHVRGG